jgi:branched-chain amino acid transport system substrate-binding protein
MSSSRYLIKGLALLLSWLFLTHGIFLQPAFAAEKRIKIAFQGPLSGPEAEVGLQQLQAVEYMVTKFNQKNSKKIKVEIVQVDDQGDPAIAVTLAPVIAADLSIIGLVGPSYSGATSISLPFYKDGSLALISPSATNPALTDPTNSRYGAPIFHRVAQTDERLGAALAKLAVEGISNPKTFLITDEQDFANLEEKLIRAGLSFIGNIKVSATSADYSSTVQEVLSKNPTTVVLTGYFPSTSKLVRQLRLGGYKNRIVLGDGSLTPEFVKLVGAPIAEGVLLATSIAPPTSLPLELQFDFKNTMGNEVPDLASTSLDATKVFLDCIGKGNSSRISMLACVKAYSGKSISGETIGFDSNGDIKGASFPRVIIKNGKFVGVLASDLNPKSSSVKPTMPVITGFTFAKKKLNISIDISKGLTPDSVYLQLPSISTKKIYATIKGKVATLVVPLTSAMYGQNLAFNVVSAKKSAESNAYSSTIEIPTQNSGVELEASKIPSPPKNLEYNFTEKGHGITVEIDTAQSSRAVETYLYSTDLEISKSNQVKGKTVGGKSAFKIDIPVSMAGKKLILNLVSKNSVGESKVFTSIIFPKAESSVVGGNIVACRKASQVRTFDAAVCPPGWSKT